MSLQNVDQGHAAGDRVAVNQPVSRRRRNNQFVMLLHPFWLDFRAAHLRLLLARLLLLAIPNDLGGRVRASVLRLAGLRFGRSTVLGGTPQISGGRDLERQLSVGRSCWFNIHCVLEVHAELTIGDRVQLGQQVMILTNTHEIGPAHQRAGPLKALPVHIGDGAWLGARCVVLPGVTIGEGSVVAAGAVVTKDVLPNTLVAGIPAKLVRHLETN